MLGVYDFCGHYEWTFAWLEQRGGKVVVEEYWDEAIHKDSQRHATALIRSKGFEGMKEYWGHSLAQEGAGYKSTSSESVFRLDIHECPSKGFLLKNQLEQYSDYCDHCIGWIGPMLREAGFVIDHQHNHCGQCWWEMREAKDASLPSQPGQWAKEWDARLHPNWKRAEQKVDTFARANSPEQKQREARVAVKTQEQRWEQLPSLPVPSGNFAGCGVVDDKIVIAGGVTWQNKKKEYLDQVWYLDTKKKTWNEGGRLPHPIAYASYGETKDGIHIIGGGSGSDALPVSGVLGRDLRYRRVSDISQPVYYPGAAVLDRKIYMAGGAEDVEDLKSFTDTFSCLDLQTGRVEFRARFPGGKIFAPGAAGLGGHFYVFGGCYWLTNQDVINRDAVFAYSIAESKWRQLKPLPFAVRGLATCILDDRRILLAGGYSDDFLQDVFIFDTKTGECRAAKPLPYRALVSVVKVGDELYCFGGEEKMRSRTGLCYRVKIKALLENY